MLNKSQPSVPFEIYSLAVDDPDLTYNLRCEELWLDVVNEICNPTFVNRSHHNVGTYDQGCRGPLCKKAHREHPKRKSPISPRIRFHEERIYDPVLEYFHTVIKHRVKNYQQEIYKQLDSNSKLERDYV